MCFTLWQFLLLGILAMMHATWKETSYSQCTTEYSQLECMAVPDCRGSIECAIICQVATPPCMLFQFESQQCIICNERVGANQTLLQLPTSAFLCVGKYSLGISTFFIYLISKGVN